MAIDHDEDLANDNVADFPLNVHVGDLPAETVLERARKKELTQCVVVGIKPDGNLYLSSTTTDEPLINWLLDKAKLDLMV